MSKSDDYTVRIPFFIWNDGFFAKLKPAAVRIYCTLHMYRSWSGEWEVTVGFSKISEMSGVSKRSVGGAITQLLEMGLIRVLSENTESDCYSYVIAQSSGQIRAFAHHNINYLKKRDKSRMSGKGGEVSSSGGGEVTSSGGGEISSSGVVKLLPGGGEVSSPILTSITSSVNIHTNLPADNDAGVSARACLIDLYFSLKPARRAAGRDRVSKCVKLWQQTYSDQTIRQAIEAAHWADFPEGVLKVLETYPTEAEIEELREKKRQAKGANPRILELTAMKDDILRRNKELSPTVEKALADIEAELSELS